MLHPSYTDLMEVVNADVEEGEEPVVNSRYSIVMATAKRARQIIGGSDPMVGGVVSKKPLSYAVEELYESKIKILPEDYVEPEEETEQEENEDTATEDASDVESGEEA